jgi:hypothetical protein
MIGISTTATSMVINCGHPLDRCRDNSGNLLSWYQQAVTGGPTRQTIQLAVTYRAPFATDAVFLYQLYGAWPSQLVESGGNITSVTFSADAISLHTNCPLPC